MTCGTGAILDVIVDLRVGSPSFGRWTAVELTEANGCAVLISEGLGHAFAALTDDAKVFYLCSTLYDPHGNAACILWIRKSGLSGRSTPHRSFPTKTRPHRRFRPPRRA